MNLIKLKKILNQGLNSSFNNSYFVQSLFSFPSKFSLPSIELHFPTPSKQTSLSCSYNIKINSTGTVYISVFHNLFYPETIYNNQIEKIKWLLKCKEREICSGNASSGHSFQFDWNLIQSNTNNGSFLTDTSLTKNTELENSIRHQLEELSKHFFTINLDLSNILVDNNNEYELKFEFPDFRLGKSVDDVRFSFNNVVPVVDIIRKQESYEGLKKGFNLWTLSKTDSSNFLGISSVILKNQSNQVEEISELDLESNITNISNYKLLAPESYPDREQEILYLKNFIPLPFAKTDKISLMNKLNEANKTGQALNSKDVSIIESALNRNFAEKSGIPKRLDLIINNCFEDKAEVIANYFYDTSNVSQNDKQIFLDGNPVTYEKVDIEFEGLNKVTAHSLSSQYDFYNAACEFFGSKNIRDVTPNYNRDFNSNSVWEASLNIIISFTEKYELSFQQWTHFISICRNRCLYRDVKMSFSFFNVSK